MLSSSLFNIQILMQLSCLWCAVCFEYFIRMRTLLELITPTHVIIIVIAKCAAETLASFPGPTPHY